ncbi:putative S-acyltransferase [Acorus calamus]|uniref:S-acyltransferase n=1 Tax=Acorus calamus TaxID=4465 RepID=A0AAV9FC21_ACOCL|nr:putative S-acyltransferase [Acorus calamus]
MPRFGRQPWSRHSPALSNPGGMTSLILKISLLLIHVVIVGFLFLFDEQLIRKTRSEPWHVLDAMTAYNDTHHAFLSISKSSEQSAPSLMQSSISSMDGRPSWKNKSETLTTAWVKQLMDLYPSGTSTRSWICAYCQTLRPPRAHHCADCDKCILKFDHHCIWLGTCIGQGNHCRFWWYIFEETVLCIWTAILYICFFKAIAEREWWQNGIAIILSMILLLCLIFLLSILIFHCYLILTNQTSYELIRRHRIPYLREIPVWEHPFSKGICRNLYDFCCSRNSLCAMEPVPTRDDQEERSHITYVN